MRTVKYVIEPQMGQPGPVRTSSDLEQFLTRCIGIINHELIPPLAILNQFLEKGKDAGKSHRWKPFQIDEEEYEELALSLLTTPGTDYQQVPPPDWVCTHTDWYYWSYEYRLGIPARRHRQLSEASKNWHQKAVRATREGNEELAAEYHMKACSIGQQLVELTEPRIARFRDTRRRR